MDVVNIALGLDHLVINGCRYLPVGQTQHERAVVAAAFDAVQANAALDGRPVPGKLTALAEAMEALEGAVHGLQEHRHGKVRLELTAKLKSESSDAQR